MSLVVRDAEDNTRVIAINGNFNFDLHRDFRNAYMNAPENSRFVLDLREADYLDSSALGMILLLREFVNEDIKRIRIINCSPEIRKILVVSNMDKIIDVQ